jgi:dCMP deaminase
MPSAGKARRIRRSPASGTRRRVDWHTYFMNIARQVASRSTCDRKHVGAVIVRDRTILSTGYNGSIRGMPHCDDVGHDIEEGHCVATIHAEANAILQAAKNGAMIDGAEIYTTASPCWNCFKLIANAGIRTIYYGEFYRDHKSPRVARQLGIALVDLGGAPADSVGCDWRGPGG